MQRVTWVVIDDHGEHAVADGLPSPDRVVCADSGVTLALALGLTVDVVVGDMDSIPRHALTAAEEAGAQVHRHDPEKDHTDLELALRVAREGTDQVVVVGGAGGRLDHALANVAAIASDELADVRVRARLGPADIHVVRGNATIDLPVGAVVTLLPSGGPVRAVTTTGLQYPLVADDLPAWTARGVSNVVTSSPIGIELDTGCLLVIHAHDSEDER